MKEMGTAGRIKGATGAFFCGMSSMLIMGFLALASSSPFIFPSLGPTALLVFHRPHAPASSPRSVLTGHLIGALSGLASLAICGLLDAPSALIEGVTFARALAGGLSLGLTSGLMVLFRRGHPPAGATTLIVSLGLMSSFSSVAILMAAVAVLTCQAALSHRLMGTRYPIWAPFDDPS